MLIPSIDLKGGRVVQLVQGERLALESDDLDGWVARFSGFPKVQRIDLDAAMGSGTNDALVRQVAPRLPSRVGGGIRSIERAREVLDYGALAIIVSSSLFRNGQPDLVFAQSLADAVGPERVIAAVDSKGGRVVIRGWTELWRVPLHACGPRGTDDRHRHDGGSGGRAGHLSPSDGGRRHHNARRN